MNSEPQVLTSGRQWYDVLMGPIEPELTSSVRPTLSEKYHRETPEQRQARLQRYRRAFAEYDRQMAHSASLLQAQAREQRRQAGREAEALDQGQTEQYLDTLQAEISQS